MEAATCRQGCRASATVARTHQPLTFDPAAHLPGGTHPGCRNRDASTSNASPVTRPPGDPRAMRSPVQPRQRRQFEAGPTTVVRNRRGATPECRRVPSIDRTGRFSRETGSASEASQVRRDVHARKAHPYSRAPPGRPSHCPTERAVPSRRGRGTEPRAERIAMTSPRPGPGTLMRSTGSLAIARFPA